MEKRYLHLPRPLPIPRLRDSGPDPSLRVDTCTPAIYTVANLTRFIHHSQIPQALLRYLHLIMNNAGWRTGRDAT